MSSVQERLQLKRTILDKWSVREHLCLASAVSCSGDQNWMSVSRTLKMLCGANRPADWFSQKSCAVQFNEILENVETPKRKKRTASERDNQNQPAETPTESIHRKLTHERINEIKILLQQEQEEYTKIREEILSIQSGQTSEEDVREMWSQIEREKEEKITEQQKYTQWLKEREERKLELQRAWRPGAYVTTSQHQNSSTTTTKPSSILKSDDMDIDETISPVAKQQQQQGTSPLLTSLLKSQSSVSNSPQIHTTNTPTTARIVAPTITNLLTGGLNSQIQSTSIISSSNQNQQPISQQPQHQFNIIHSQPLTGPPIQISQQTPQLIQSPSQAAPTLSSLLETKKAVKLMKENTNTTTVDIIESTPKTNEEPMETEDDENSNASNKELMDVFDNLLEENINELAEILTNNNAIIPEILDQDLENVELEDESQDEQFLNIEKREIPIHTEENSNIIKNIDENSKNIPDSVDLTIIKDEIIKYDETGQGDIESKIIPSTNTTATKIQDSSGDDQIDNKTETTVLTIDDAENDSKNLQLINTDIKEEITESENSVQFVETKEESQESVVEIKEDIKIDNNEEEKDNLIITTDNSKNIKLNFDDDKNTEISEDSGDVTFQELTNEINEKIKADNDQESKQSSEDIMEITDNIRNIQSIENDDKKFSFNYEDSHDTIMHVEDNVSKNIDEHENDKLNIEMPDIKQKSSISESSDVIIIPEDEESNEKKEIEKIIFAEKPKEEEKKNVIRIDNKVTSEPKEEVKIHEVDNKTNNERKNKVEPIEIIKIQPEKQKTIIESTTITIIDTDDDSTHLEPQKEEKPTEPVTTLAATPISSKLSTSRRDYSRKKSDTTESSSSSSTLIVKKCEEPDENKQNLSVRKLRDSNRDGSESPFVDDDLMNESLPRTRRRYSSTPVIDSIPNSPASSSDAGDQKVWKKSMLIAYNRLINHKNSSIFLRLFNDDQAPKFKQICLRPMDLHTIKRNIENGTIKTTTEFQRDVMLVCQNAMMYYKKNTVNFNAAKELMTEIISISEHITEKDNKKDKDEKLLSTMTSQNNLSGQSSTDRTTSISSNNSSSGIKSRPTGSRKSQRLP